MVLKSANYKKILLKTTTPSLISISSFLKSEKKINLKNECVFRYMLESNVIMLISIVKNEKSKT